MREGQKNGTPQDKSQAKCYVEKFQKLLKRFEQNIPSNVTRNPNMLYISITKKSATTAEPSETQTTSKQNCYETQGTIRYKVERRTM